MSKNRNDQAAARAAAFFAAHGGKEQYLAKQKAAREEAQAIREVDRLYDRAMARMEHDSNGRIARSWGY